MTLMKEIDIDRENIQLIFFSLICFFLFFCAMVFYPEYQHYVDVRTESQALKTMIANKQFDHTNPGDIYTRLHFLEKQKSMMLRKLDQTKDEALAHIYRFVRSSGLKMQSSRLEHADTLFARSMPGKEAGFIKYQELSFLLHMQGNYDQFLYFLAGLPRLANVYANAQDISIEKDDSKEGSLLNIKVMVNSYILNPDE